MNLDFLAYQGLHCNQNLLPRISFNQANPWNGKLTYRTLGLTTRYFQKHFPGGVKQVLLCLRIELLLEALSHGVVAIRNDHHPEARLHLIRLNEMLL
jgi:hypothetical protein